MRPRQLNKRARWRLGLVTALLSSNALGAPHQWDALDAAALDRARGGFTLPAGLQVSLGIERMVAINGDMVAQTRLDLPDTAGASRSGTSAMLIQTGVGNVVSPELVAGLQGATLIQNSLSGQQIDSRTVIHATVNSHALLDSLNFHGHLRDALARAAAVR